MKTDDFYNGRYKMFAKYDNYRKLADFYDGLKASARKIIWTVYDKNITSLTKVDTLANLVASHTLYIHGANNLEGVTVGLTAKYQNNLTLLEEAGSFGNRFTPSPAASRYIKTCKSDMFDKVINKEMYLITENQIFENQEIEPNYLVTNIPLLLTQGVDSIAVGFRQIVLPRSVSSIIEYLKGKRKDLDVSYPEFSGPIKRLSNTQFLISGTFTRINTTTLEINEIPIGYDDISYKKVLIELLEKDLIEDYDDHSIKNTFKFVIKMKRELLKRSDAEIIKMFKLEQTRSDVFVVYKDGKVIEYESAEKYLDDWIVWRLSKEQEYINKKLEKEIENLSYMNNKLLFIKLILDDKIVFKNQKKKEIVDQMIMNKIQSEYCDKLLQIPLYSLSIDSIIDEENKIKEQEKLIAKLKTIEPRTQFISYLKDIK